jgi:hypothetical protein
MQFPPEAAQLLHAIATLLEDDVLPAVAPELQHRVRVAAHLARLLEREVRLGPDIDARERDALGGRGSGSTTLELAAALADRLRTEDDPAALTRAWTALVAIARDDLSIAKPGYDEWEGE